MMRNTVPFFGGCRRNARSIASALPRLSAGVARVSHSSVTVTLPVPRCITCGDGPSDTKTDFPSALWPVTTRRIGFDIARPRGGGNGGSRRLLRRAAHRNVAIEIIRGSFAQYVTRAAGCRCERGGETRASRRALELEFGATLADRTLRRVRRSNELAADSARNAPRRVNSP